MRQTIRFLRETVVGLPGAFWWLWIATVINRAGGFVATFLALYLTTDRGYSPTLAGAVIAIYAAGGLVGSLLGGVLVDLVGRRPVLLSAQLANAAFTLLLWKADTAWTIPLAVGLVGVASSASRPAISAITADVVPPSDQQRAFSLNFWAINIGFSIGSTVAGFAATRGFGPIFIAQALATVFAAFVVFWKVKETKEPVEDARGIPSRILGQGAVYRDRVFLLFAGLMAFVILTYAQSTSSLPITMQRDGLGSSAFGVVIGLNGILIVVLQVAVTRLIARVSFTVLLVGSAAITGIGFGLTYFASNIWFYAATVVIWTLGEAVLAPTATAVVVSMAPARLRGSYLGVDSLASSLPSMIGPALGGAALGIAGDGALWGGCFAVGMISAVGFLLLVTRNKQRFSGAEGASTVKGVKDE